MTCSKCGLDGRTEPGSAYVVERRGTLPTVMTLCLRHVEEERERKDNLRATHTGVTS